MAKKQPHGACGAKTRNGVECGHKPMQNGRCRFHGGKTPNGIASPQFKTGEYSRYISAIPKRIEKDFEQLRKRDDLLRLNDDIALIDTRILDVLRRVEMGEAGALWKELQKAHQAYKAAREEDADKRLAELETLIERGVTDWQAWNEVKVLIEQRRKLVESERKREVEQQEILTGREAAALFNALLSIVNEHVTDRDTKQRIQTAVTGLITSEVRSGLKLAG